MSFRIRSWNIWCKVEVKDNLRTCRKKVLRYSELRKEMENITDAVLASTLKELINDDIILRKQFDEIPPRVEYSLTEKGVYVVPILQSICKWSGAYHKEDKENALLQCQKCDYNNWNLGKVYSLIGFNSLYEKILWIRFSI